MSKDLEINSPKHIECEYRASVESCMRDTLVSPQAEMSLFTLIKIIMHYPELK